MLPFIYLDTPYPFGNNHAPANDVLHAVRAAHPRTHGDSDGEARQWIEMTDKIAPVLRVLIDWTDATPQLPACHRMRLTWAHPDVVRDETGTVDLVMTDISDPTTTLDFSKNWEGLSLQEVTAHVLAAVRGGAPRKLTLDERLCAAKARVLAIEVLLSHAQQAVRTREFGDPTPPGVMCSH